MHTDRSDLESRNASLLHQYCRRPSYLFFFQYCNRYSNTNFAFASIVEIEDIKGAKATVDWHFLTWWLVSFCFALL